MWINPVRPNTVERGCIDVKKRGSYMRIDCLSIFPDIIADALQHSIPGKAQERGLIEIKHHDIRDYATDKHHKTDDIPYGGGAGMVFKPEPVVAALRAVRSEGALVIHPSPAAPRLTQADVLELARQPALVFIASRYEGLDQRVVDHYVDREYSLGDFVISGGELACAVMIDAVVRQLPGAVGKRESVEQDSFSAGLLDYPHYTRPADFDGHAVPEVLLNGHHEQIRLWRKRQALARTLKYRPDLLENVELDPEAKQILERLKNGG
jgi:tRNA (guanine37-N1)-methyltransferase